MKRSKIGPDPVSCTSCRSKKLKCNRVQPCSNCVARNISCTFLVPPHQRTETNSELTSNEQILERLERLEATVHNSSSIQPPPKEATQTTHLLKHWSSHDLSDDVVETHVDKERDDDSQLLENVGTREDSLVSPCLTDGLAFQISSVQEILESHTSFKQPLSASQHDRSRDNVVIFPVYEVAVQLFEAYESHLDHMCRILHVPTVRSLLKTFYLRISQHEPVPPGQAALLLSIFAIAAYFYPPSESSEIATTDRDAVCLSKFLCKGALDVLDHSRRSTSGTLEDIQASIIMSLATHHLDGFSARGRFLLTAATSIARDLRLHRLDSDSEVPSRTESSVRILMDREVKRRVFWYIASQDWMLSVTSGPQEGTYFIHPNQINVKLPKDCSDDDLFLGEENESNYGPQPSGMTFLLEKVRLAHLCREITDTVPLEVSDLIKMPYQHIVSLDNKFEDLIASLPFFFKLDVESRRKSKALEMVYPMIPVWRYCIQTAIHSRKCKLHHRFLLRQSLNPRYAYSRRACLESARTTINVYEDLAGFYSPSTLMTRMGMAVHFTHLALVVMVMDLCFNKNEVDEAEIKRDVKAALQIFEDARDTSPLLGRCLSSLGAILQKHKVYLTDQLHSTTQEKSFNTSIDDQTELAQGEEMVYDHGVAIDASIDEFWQIAFQSEPNFDSLAWDNLFSAIDTRPM